MVLSRLEKRELISSSKNNSNCLLSDLLNYSIQKCRSAEIDSSSCSACSEGCPTFRVEHCSRNIKGKLFSRDASYAFSDFAFSLFMMCQIFDAFLTGETEVLINFFSTLQAWLMWDAEHFRVQSILSGFKKSYKKFVAAKLSRRRFSSSLMERNKLLCLLEL